MLFIVVMRLRKVEEFLIDLEKCYLGNILYGYEILLDLDGIKRDLVICKIYEILEKNVEIFFGEKFNDNKCEYVYIWNFFK